MKLRKNMIKILNKLFLMKHPSHLVVELMTVIFQIIKWIISKEHFLKQKIR